MKLDHKVALITGAGRGIGADTARLFAKLGATLSLLSTTEQNLLTVASECEQLGHGQPTPLTFVGSVTNAELCQKAIDDTVKTFGKLDILVNNASTSKETFLLTSPIEDYDEIFNTNLRYDFRSVLEILVKSCTTHRSVIVLTQYAAPHLINSKGCVINVSSVGGTKAAPGRIFYGMSKACLNHFTRYAAQELGQYQVRVNTISPGYVKTGFPVSNYGLQSENLEKYYEKASSSQILRRCADGSEIANAIAFLASDESSFMTGTELVMDGGYLINVQSSQIATTK